MKSIWRITPTSTAWHRLTMAALLTGSVLSMGTALHAAEPSILVTIDNVTVEEPRTGSRYAYFTVTLSEEPLRDVEIRYATAEDTAHEFEDYYPASGRVIFRVV
jgi:hypothetical protein